MRSSRNGNFPFFDTTKSSQGVEKRFRSLPTEELMFMRTTITKIGLIVLLAVGTVGLTGCDSGGSGGTEESSLEKTDGVMVNLKDSETSSSAQKATVTGNLTVDFYYQNDSKENCTMSAMEKDVSPGYNGSFSPSNSEGNCENISDFDGVRAHYKADSDTSPLELEILTEDGSETIASVVSENAGNGMESAETISDDVTIPDEIGGGLVGGDDGSGDDGTGGGDTIDSASELANTIQGVTWRTPTLTVDEGNVNWARFNKPQGFDFWVFFALESGCALGVRIFKIIDGSTIELAPSSETPDVANVSYTDGTLTIKNYRGDGGTLTLKRAEKDPFQDRGCDFDDVTDDDLGY